MTTLSSFNQNHTRLHCIVKLPAIHTCNPTPTLFLVFHKIRCNGNVKVFIYVSYIYTNTPLKYALQLATLQAEAKRVALCIQQNQHKRSFDRHHHHVTYHMQQKSFWCIVSCITSFLTMLAHSSAAKSYVLLIPKIPTKRNAKLFLFVVLWFDDDYIMMIMCFTAATAPVFSSSKNYYHRRRVQTSCEKKNILF